MGFHPPQEIGRTRDGRPKYQKFLQDYEGGPNKGEAHEHTTLRGHKLYWHRGPSSQADIEVEDDYVRDVVMGRQEPVPGRNASEKQYTQIKPVAAGVTFTFDIRFENLSDTELGAILWALQLPGEQGGEYRHKLGMGKPLGMGSVHIKPELHLTDRTTRYRTLFDGNRWFAGEPDSKDIREFVDAYDHCILHKLTAHERDKATALHETPRLRTLFKLFEWPGKSKEESRYMEIERRDAKAKRGKRNEYRDRPVLPMPIDTKPPEMKGAPEESTSPQSLTSSDRPESAERAQARSELAAEFMQRLGQSQPAQSQPAQMDPASEEPTPDASSDSGHEVDRPASKDEVKPGMYLEGTITDMQANSLIIDLGIDGVKKGSLSKDDVEDFDEVEDRFSVGDSIYAWVKKAANRKGNVPLTLKEPKR